jgi:cytochrome c553
VKLKRWIKAAIVIGAIGAIGGLTVLVAGLVPLKASSGHWAITEWFLQFGKRRSVATYTLLADTPALDEPWLALKGAGHYELGCRPCHGAPDLPRQPRVARAMLPPPPPLDTAAATWDTSELIFIVQHGIKFTGMPSWPALGREDEVHAIVAFLQKLPTLDGAGYRRLVDGPVDVAADPVPLTNLVGAESPPRAVRTTCARCHGVDGSGRGNAAFPAIGGQRLAYLRDALAAYVAGERHSGIMETALSGLSDEDLDTVAAYYAKQATTRTSEGDHVLRGAIQTREPESPIAIARGRAIATHGIPAQRVPSCIDCHGPASQPENEHAPILAGQYAEYLVLQLELFAQDRRGGAAHAHLMDHVAHRLEPQQMHDVAAYFASLARQ